jgi:hypothetical protein
LGGNFNQTGRIITLPKVAEKNASGMKQLVDQDEAKDLTNTSIKLEDLSSGTYYVKQSLTIEASKLAKGQHLVLVAPTSTDTITIAGNIEINPSSNSFNNLSEIPSLTIIASKIYVSGYTTTTNTNAAANTPITKLYGTYIAKDRFYTCNKSTAAALAGALSHSTTTTDNGLCQNQLTLQGSVISKNRPNNWRTYGAGKDDISIPSEVFQYIPNLYLTPYALSQEGNANDWGLADLRQLPARL